MMARFFTFFLFLSFLTSLHAQSYSDLIVEAQSAFNSRDFDIAANKYLEAFNLVGSPLPGDIYKAAKCYSLNGHLDQGFDLLNRAISGGWMELEITLNDDDLVDMQMDDRWPATLNRMLEKQ